MRKTIIIAAAVLVAAFAMANPPDQKDSFPAAFEKLKSLAGEWKIADRDAQVSYFVTGDGSAVVEVFETERGMASVYHMDGEDLMVTHYCSANNQPRMRATSYDAARGTILFDQFIDVTNVADPEEYYTREVGIVFKDQDHIEIRFNGLEAGEEFPVVQSLSRK